MNDQTVYMAHNRCRHTGLERLVKRWTLPDGRILRLYRDNFNQHRAVLFKSAAHEVGCAGVCVDAYGDITHKEECAAMEGTAPTALLIAFMRVNCITVNTDEITP